MATALFLLIYVYFPFLQLILPINRISSSDFPLDRQYAIEIPKINAYAPIIENVDPWDKNDYEPKLKEGVGLSKDSVKFGEKGSIFMFAHSSLPPWEMTRANTSFLKLYELEKGDEVRIIKLGKVYTYSVTEKKEVWPNDVKSLAVEKRDVLILQTCTPLGTDLRRLLVYAEPTKTE